MTDATTKGGPLAGIKVLDFTHAAAGPYATMFMGDMGAEVIKIERPGRGDGARTMGVPMPTLGRKESDYFVSLNRNKKGIAVDLGRSEGIELARRLAQCCDVVVQNFRPGVMERLGLGYQDLRKLREGLVYCSISAYGAKGPWSEKPANDIIMQSVSGLMGVTGEVGGGPVRIGAPISDFSSGLFALSGVLGALLARERFPEGQHVEVAMLDASLNLMCNYIPSVAGLGHTVPRLGRGHAQIVPYQAFLCADGEYVMVGAFTRNFWQNLCHAVGHPEWITDPRYASNPARLENRADLVGKLEEIFATRDRSQWLAVLEEADVPCSPVLELHDAIRSEQAAFNHSVVPLGDPADEVFVAKCPITVGEWQNEAARKAPSIGRDTESVLRDVLNMSPGEIGALSANETIYCATQENTP